MQRRPRPLWQDALATKTVDGDEALPEDERRHLKSISMFEEKLLQQKPREFRGISNPLDIAWTLLRTFVQESLKRSMAPAQASAGAALPRERRRELWSLLVDANGTDKESHYNRQQPPRQAVPAPTSNRCKEEQ